MIRNVEKPKTSRQFYNKPDQAKAYSKYRPEPPSEVVDVIISYLSEKISSPFNQAVDVGCGTGQSTIVLSPYFSSVIGFDISESQIKEASYYRKVMNVNYRISPAECLPVADQSIQLLTAATCFHWLDAQAFFKEADRVLVPGGVLAIYSSPNNYPVSEDKQKHYLLRQLTDKFLYEDLSPYRSSRVQQESEQFIDINFPFDDIIRVKNISQTYWSNVEEAVGYIQSMSTFQTFRTVDPQRADMSLQEYQHSILKILEADTVPENTAVACRKDYFLILGRKRM